jgi:hypothetical protein
VFASLAGATQARFGSDCLVGDLTEWHGATGMRQHVSQEGLGIISDEGCPP